MRTLNKIVISSLLIIAFTACGSGSSSNSQPTIPVVPTTLAPVFTDHNQCANPYQNIPQVGVPGNTACPYQGAFDPNLGYQGYAFHFSAGIGFRIDFGWDYNDMCPQVGERPIFQNGGFSHCTSVNPVFAQVDNSGLSYPNLGECAGDQLNPEITGCRSQLQPMAVPNYNIPASQVPGAVVTDPVLSI